MRRENSVVTLSSDDPHIISITLPQPKMRVKFPKLLLKTVQRRSHGCSNESKVDQTKAEKGSKSGDFLVKRIGLMIWNACGRRKAQEMSSSFDQPVATDNADGSCLKNQDLVAEQEKITFSKSNSYNEIPEAKESATLEEEVHAENWAEKSGEVDHKPTKMSGFFIRGVDFHFRKWKLDEKRNGGARQISCSKGLDETLRVKPIFRRIKTGKRVPEKMVTRDVEEEETSEVELCKKRILMGEKCRPLNLSGALHYDENGVLLPEEVLF